MALSTQVGKSILAEHSEHASQSEERNSGCELANLLNQSLMLYLEIEKTHWHLRLNPSNQTGSFEYEGSIETARELCAITLQLISRIARLERDLHPDMGPECTALLDAVADKIAENRGLAREGQHDPESNIPAIAVQTLRSAGRFDLAYSSHPDNHSPLEFIACQRIGSARISG